MTGACVYARMGQDQGCSPLNIWDVRSLGYSRAEQRNRESSCRNISLNCIQVSNAVMICKQARNIPCIRRLTTDLHICFCRESIG
jgi:hypothetical protein